MTALDSWSAAMSYLAVRFREHETLGSEAIRFGYMLDGQELEMFVKRTDRPSSTWLAIGVRLVVDVGIELAPLLRVRESVGNVCLFGNHLCVMHNVPLRGMTTELIDQAMAMVGAATLRYRSRIERKDAGAATPFAFYAE